MRITIAAAALPLLLPFCEAEDVAARKPRTLRTSSRTLSAHPLVKELSAPLDWSIRNAPNETASGTIPYFTSANAFTDASIVAARLAGATSGISDLYDLSPYVLERTLDANYANDVHQFVSNLYVTTSLAYPDALLNLSGGPVVVSTVHRTGLYVAEALHAPLLLGQIIGFATNWEEACVVSKDQIVIVASDYGYHGMYLWIKPANADGVPEAQKEQLALASDLVLVGSSSDGGYEGGYDCAANGFEGETLYVHTSLQYHAGEYPTSAIATLYRDVKDLLTPLPADTNQTIRQLEWGLPSPTIQAYRDVWAALGKDDDRLVVVEDETTVLFNEAARVWESYLHENAEEARGITSYSYWISAPTMDRLDRTLPLPHYSFYTPAFTFMYDAAKSFIAPIINRLGVEEVGKHTRFFVNAVGSVDTIQAAHTFLSELGLLSSNPPPSVTVGYDAPNSECWGSLDDYLGMGSSFHVPCAHKVAESFIASHPNDGKVWQPLPVEDLTDTLLECMSCEASGTKVYLNGAYCCRMDLDYYGNPIHFTSTTCDENNAYACPTGDCCNSACVESEVPEGCTDRCPCGTYAYYGGGYCCRQNDDGYGNPIKYDSTSCKGNDYLACPAGTDPGTCCDENSKDGLTCVDCPYGSTPYGSGAYCCSEDQDKNLNPLHYTSFTCLEDAYQACPGGTTPGSCCDSACVESEVPEGCTNSTMCPCGTYAYYGGGYCCRQNDDGYGNPITYDSTSCKGNDWLPCPAGTDPGTCCDENSKDGPTCVDCPYGSAPYGSGAYCCSKDQDKNLNPLHYTSFTCLEDAYQACPGGTTPGSCCDSACVESEVPEGCTNSTMCPCGTYAYYGGGYCCRQNDDGYGNPITYDSTSCKGNDWLPCPAGTDPGTCCDENSKDGPTCVDCPYGSAPYGSGAYCCSKDQDKNLNPLHYTSFTCLEDAYQACPGGTTPGSCCDSACVESEVPEGCTSSNMCPCGTYAYYGGGYCCRQNDDGYGNPITYDSTSCKGSDWLACPAGTAAGSCCNPSFGQVRLRF